MSALGVDIERYEYLKPLGGFFETHRPDGRAAGPSLLEVWTGVRAYSAFVNARSAFAALAAAFPHATVWMPAFLCTSLLHADYAQRTRLYSVKDGFEPNLEVVETNAIAGDLVLIPSYFGLPFSGDARAFMARRTDLRIVEDCAQALEPGAASGSGGTWRLHSPRKLVGVADGGLLIALRDNAFLPDPTAAADAAALWEPLCLRSKDAQGRDGSIWHQANQAKELGMNVGSQALTPLSFSILSNTSFETLKTARVRNWRILDQHLATWRATQLAPPVPQLGYVLQVAQDQRDRLLQNLHAERIFAAVHWREIVGPSDDFPREAQWARQLITLPCDHRYDKADMDRIGACVLKHLG